METPQLPTSRSVEQEWRATGPTVGGADSELARPCRFWGEQSRGYREFGRDPREDSCAQTRDPRPNATPRRSGSYSVRVQCTGQERVGRSGRFYHPSPWVFSWVCRFYFGSVVTRRLWRSGSRRGTAKEDRGTLRHRCFRPKGRTTLRHLRKNQK